MRIWFFLLITIGILQASSISTPLLTIEDKRGAIEAPQLKVGMSGFVVRHFDATHSSIIANARVTQISPSSNRAIIEFSNYDGLRQNSLPSGTWSPKVADEVVIAYDYGRALLIAPNDDAYLALTASIPNIEWIHPDLYATYLSHEGHPTPLVEDFRRFCTSGSIGLLFVQSAQTLFTLDCKNFTLLQSTESVAQNQKAQTPFYTRVPKIRAAWWGEGSSTLENYEPYYLELIALSNPKNKELYALYKAKFGEKSALLRHFELKE
jgi:hypothetical protein